MLAGLVKSPRRWRRTEPEAARQRAPMIVLAAMADAEFITAAQAKAATDNPSTMRAGRRRHGNYVADWIGEVLDYHVGTDRPERRGRDDVDRNCRRTAEAAIIDELAAKGSKIQRRRGCAGGDDGPRARYAPWSAGATMPTSQYNRAVTAKRQPGSAFKPFIYLTAIEKLG